MTTYQIMPTIAEESLESWIWTNDTNVSTNGFIVIHNPKNGKSIKTFKRTIDNNFVKNYATHNTNEIELDNGKKYLIINEYFRIILGVQSNSEMLLEIKRANCFQKLLLIHWSHPNPTVQFGNRATIFSIIVGAIALLLTIFSI